MIWIGRLNQDLVVVKNYYVLICHFIRNLKHESVHIDPVILEKYEYLFSLFALTQVHWNHQ